MRTIEFKLPKTLHNGDVFKQELKLDKYELWRGFNKDIHVTNRNEYAKINNIITFVFHLGSESTPSLLTVPIGLLPRDERTFHGQGSEWLNSPQSFYDMGVIDINCKEIPLKVYIQELSIFKLFIHFKDKKYIKFKKEPIIFINIFNCC